MEFGISTPALLFPAISLLMLSYTNRFLSISSVVRKLLESYKSSKELSLLEQISALRFRLVLIKYMQSVGIISIILCVFSMGALFLGDVVLGKIIFGISLVFMLASLCLLLWEITLSANALDVALRDIGEK